jgi:O-antigen/teichoic acid export membrane protein
MSASADLSLKTRVLRAGGWSLAAYAFGYSFRLTGSLLMTRLLVPQMFGIVAVASLVQTGLAMISDIGLKPNIVQNSRGDDSAFLNTAWLIQIARGALLSVLGLILSIVISLLQVRHFLPAGSVYDDSILPSVIAVSSFSQFFLGLESTKSLQASRNLLLAHLARIEIASQIVGFAVMLSIAMIHPTIWAIVTGGLTSTISKTILSHVWLPGVSNRIEWCSSAFAEFLSFGRWIFASTLLFFGASNGDRLVLAASFDATALGTYAIAFLFFSAIDQLLDKLSWDLCFPALSEIIRTDQAKARSVYYKFHNAMALVAYLVAGILFFSGQSLIYLLYDVRYQDAGWMLQILAVAVVTFPFRIAAQSQLAFGNPHIFYQLNLIRVLCLFSAAPLGIYLAGLEGGIWGIVASYFSSIPLIWYHAARVGFFDLRKEATLLLAVIVGSMAGALINLIVARSLLS